MIKTIKPKSISLSALVIATVVLFSGCAMADEKSDAKQEKGPTEQTETETPTKDYGIDKKVHISEINKSNTPPKKGRVEEKNPPTKVNAALIQQIYQFGQEGKVPGSDFVSGIDLIDNVHESWGDPDEPIGPGNPYETYSSGVGKGTFAFGIGRGDIIYDIHSFGSGIDQSVDFSQVSFQDIKQTLGNPTAIRKNNKDEILVYAVQDYEIKFIGPHATQMLHHISVYSPKAAAPMGNK
ncbi:YjgB family protein [Sporosarcina limicola]|uniref:DUF4309 domain-containing protein n=1 Tax=Sporosarcina limicola TaxID=34101 RepID=A0A927MJF9_9BACL|nr:YjgB family protein [Sporosarcina limicola]MBE1555800.1 hypothetical protein [Sporosarcina limicola]